MDVEKLKIMLEAFTALGDNAKDGLIWYVATMALVEVVAVMGWMALVYAGYKVAVLIANKVAQVEENAGSLRAIRDLLEIGSVGYVTLKERKEIFNRISKMKETLEGSKNG